MAVAAFSNTIVFGSVWMSGEVSDAICGKKMSEFNIFSPSVRVKGDYFGVEVVFYKSFKGCED